MGDRRVLYIGSLQNWFLFSKSIYIFINFHSTFISQVMILHVPSVPIELLQLLNVKKVFTLMSIVCSSINMLYNDKHTVILIVHDV